jgi:hypothetical protein
VQSRFESVQALEEGAHHKTYTQGGLVPILNWYIKSLWQGCAIKPIAHAAVSSGLVSLISTIKRIARQQKSVECETFLPLHTP